MRRKLFTVNCLLITVLFSCTPRSSQTAPSNLQAAFYLYRFDPPALVQFSAEFQPLHEIPFSVPPSCGLFDIFPTPVGKFMVIELSCPNGQTVLFLDTDAGVQTQPITDSDSHFLAWTPDGKAAYLKVDSMGNTQVVRVSPNGAKDPLSIPMFTYDLAPSIKQGEFTYTFSRGLGQGSELWLAQRDGKTVRQIYADLYNYTSYARYSPDGKQIAFIKTPDTQTPFTVGELWIMDSEGSNARRVADADAGHGYAANWSPDGKRIAFVMRENPEDEHADQSSDALISNIYIVDVENGELTQLTHFTEGRAETPFWSPNGNTLAFTVVMNGRMQVQIADILSGKIQPPIMESTCCPAWMRK